MCWKSKPPYIKPTIKEIIKREVKWVLCLFITVVACFFALAGFVAAMSQLSENPWKFFGWLLFAIVMARVTITMFGAFIKINKGRK